MKKLLLIILCCFIGCASTFYEATFYEASLGGVSAGAPVLFFSDLPSGPDTGGENNDGVFVTIWGKNFGAVQGSSIVTVGGGAVASYQTWGTDAGTGLDMVCFQLGSDAATGDIVLTTALGVSNGIPFTVRAGNIYFCDITAGVDGDGSFASPWNDLTNFYNAVVAGDTIYFRESAFADQWEGRQPNLSFPGLVVSIMDMNGANTEDGTESDPIAWVGYPEETVTWTATNLAAPFEEGTEKCTVVLKLGSYNVVSNMTFTARTNATQGSTGFRGIGNNFSMPYGGYQAMNTWNASYTKQLGNYFHDCGSEDNNTQWHSVYMGGDDIDDFEVGWNVFRNNTYGFEIQLFFDNIASNYYYKGSIHDNQIYDCNRGISAGWCADGTDIKIYNNILDGTDGSYGMFLFADDEIGLSADFYVYNNLLYYSSNIELGHGAGVEGAFYLANNILVEDDGNYIEPTTWDFVELISNNCYYGTGNGPVQDASAVNADPEFDDAANEDFHVDSGSPCVDDGVDTSAVVTMDLDGVTRPQNAVVDIGTYEQ